LQLKKLRISNTLHNLSFRTGFSAALVKSEIKSESIDYWLGWLPLRCTISIIYHKFICELLLISSYDIPVILIPVQLSKEDFQQHLWQKSQLKICFRGFEKVNAFSIYFTKVHHQQ